MSKRVEIIALCEKLLRELGYKPLYELEKLVNDAHRIAQLANDDDAAAFFYAESVGYTQSGGRYDEFLRSTGRWDGGKTVYEAPAAMIEDGIRRIEADIRSLQARVSPAPFQNFELSKALAARVSELQVTVQQHRMIVHQVRGHIHRFASRTIARLKFAEQTDDIFSAFQRSVDTKIATTAAKAFEKLPAVFERLSAGDREAISQALTSCRRILEAFADAVFPPSATPVNIDGVEFECKPGKTKNQLRAYIRKGTRSESRRDRLNKNMGELWARMSGGVHADVTPGEARALVLNTYLLLGELVELED